MAELAIRRGNGGAMRRSPGVVNPFRYLREMMKWDPFSEMAPLLGAQPMEGVSPAFDVVESQQAFVFKADLPGFNEKDLDITCSGNVLTISGSRRNEREEKGDTYYVCERSHGSFTRAFTLPQGADSDHMNAVMKEGVLTVTVPRLSPAPSRKIPVKAVTATAKA